MRKIIALTMTTLILAGAVLAQSDVKTRIDANMMFVRREIQRAIDDPKTSTADDVQKLLFEPEVWKSELAKIVNAQPSEFPENWRESVMDKLGELRGLIDTSGKTRAWEQPAFKRPTEEAMAKAKFLAYYKGSSVLKTGSSFNDWKTYKNTLGIPTNRFIRGWALLKIVNRPYCQAQEWVVKQTYAGGKWSPAKVDSFGGGGVFMKCE